MEKVYTGEGPPLTPTPFHPFTSQMEEDVRSSWMTLGTGEHTLI